MTIGSSFLDTRRSNLMTYMQRAPLGGGSAVASLSRRHALNGAAISSRSPAEALAPTNVPPGSGRSRNRIPAFLAPPVGSDRGGAFSVTKSTQAEGHSIGDRSPTFARFRDPGEWLAQKPIGLRLLKLR
jgi:hypothetical protein